MHCVEARCASKVVGGGRCIGSKTYGTCFVVRLRGDFFSYNMLSLVCVMLWVERNICEHDKLVFRRVMVETEATYHQKKKKIWCLYVTSICIKSVAHSTRFYQLY
jgi:hypothetical protein